MRGGLLIAVAIGLGVALGAWLYSRSAPDDKMTETPPAAIVREAPEPEAAPEPPPIPAPASVTEPEASPEPIEPPGDGIAGMVVDEAGEPVAGAEVAAYRAQTGAEQTETSAPPGLKRVREHMTLLRDEQQPISLGVLRVWR